MSLNLCNSCVGDHLDNDPSRHNLNFFRYYPNIPRKDVKTTANNATNLFSPFALLPIFTKKHTFLEISDISKRRKETITDDTKDLKEIVSPEYACIVQQVDYDAGILEEDYEIL